MDGNGHSQPLPSGMVRLDPPELLPLLPPVHVGRFGSRWELAAAVLAGVLVGWAITRPPR